MYFQRRFKFSIGFIAAVFCLAVSCRQNHPIENMPANPIEKSNSTPEDTITNIEVKTFEVDGGWGYDIYLNGEKYIHQVNIPSVNGLYVFRSEADAYKVANIMVMKIRNHILPPSITQQDISNAGVVVQ